MVECTLRGGGHVELMSDDQQHDTSGTPRGEQNDEQADIASGGAPDDPDDVDPPHGTNEEGRPADDPSG
ncbi:hypothetical protein GCM10022287_17040 [Gryllotalpicola koreensis]|uniref:Uncharacterized protein n=2 Tax=Gryllotalpicola koreensis TaxID=993086 RepID=A0ABP7ZZ03_9MICO